MKRYKFTIHTETTVPIRDAREFIHQLSGTVPYEVLATLSRTGKATWESENAAGNRVVSLYMFEVID